MAKKTYNIIRTGSVKPLADPETSGWYEFSQNNSGGHFHKDGGHSTYIWASSPDEANRIAEQHGIYFDGCANGRDCPCCGDRWSRKWSSSKPEHLSFDELVKKLTEKRERWLGQLKSNLDYATEWGLGIRIIDHDGSVVWLRANETKKLK